MKKTGKKHKNIQRKEGERSLRIEHQPEYDKTKPKKKGKDSEA